MAFFMKKNIFTYFLLLITLSASAQWNAIKLPTSASLRAIKTFQKEIWIGGTEGTYIHSMDDGNSWKVQQVPGAENLDFRDLIIINKNEIIIMSAGPSEKNAAKLFKTSDGGLTWDIIFNIKEPNYFFDAITWDFKKNIGLLLSDPIAKQFVIFKILENGKQISEIKLTQFPSLLTNEAAFAASGSSLLWINKKLNIASGGGHHARIFQSTDSNLKAWKITNSEISADPTSGFFTLAAKNKNHFWVAGGNYLTPQTSKIPILESRNAGKDWAIVQNQLPNNYFIEKIIWSRPYWIITGPAGSFAYHTILKQWKTLGESHYHNIVETQNKFIGIGGKGQVGYLSKSTLKALFLPKK